MSEVEIFAPKDDFGKWLFETVTGQKESVKIGIPGTEVVDGVQQRLAVLFEVIALLEEMNENMKNIDVGIKELNTNIKELGLGGFEDGTED